MLGRRLTAALIAGGATLLFFACASGESDIGGPGRGGYSQVGGSGATDAAPAGNGGKFPVGGGGGSWPGSGGSSAAGGVTGGAGGGGGTIATGGVTGGGGSTPTGGTTGGGGSGATGGTIGGGGSGATGAIGGTTGGGGSGATGGTTNIVPTNCSQAHGVVGCCGPDGKVYWWECGKLQVGPCNGNPCGWDANNGWYSCAGSGFTGSDPSGVAKKECGGTNPSPGTCPGAICPCSSKCGSSSPTANGCYCDSYCLSSGDCCPDACPACGIC